jgi:hypothetical protein
MEMTMPHDRFAFIARTAAAALAVAAFAATPLALRAQDHPDRPDQPPEQHQDDHALPHGDTHPEPRAEGHPDEIIVGYRRDHPGRYARCKDGFFTTTSDRSRACRKHGGIDVWIGQ